MTRLQDAEEVQIAVGVSPHLGGGRGPEKEVNIQKSLAYPMAVVVQTMGVSSVE